MWSNGSISDTVAQKCPQFEPVRYESIKTLKDLYNMHNGEIAPVVHGEWNTLHIGLMHCVAECSVCGKTATGNHYDYCPNCGAKMDGGKSE